MNRKSSAIASAGALVLASLATTGGSSAAASDDDRADGHRHAVRLSAEIDPLNNSGVTGTATASVAGNLIRAISVNATGLAPDLPHPVHIHFGEEATHECPDLALDPNRDFRIGTVEGLPAYGEVAVSLTKSGDTSATSILALDRFSSAPGGVLGYRRRNITFTDTATQQARNIARGVRAGGGVVVVHGVDYNQNGRYDLAGGGESEISAGVPAETTDPAACGPLRLQH